MTNNFDIPILDMTRFQSYSTTMNKKSRPFKTAFLKMCWSKLFVHHQAFCGFSRIAAHRYKINAIAQWSRF